MSGTVMRMLLAALAAVGCTQLLRGKSPSMAFLVSVAALLGLLGILLPLLREAWQEMRGILEQTGLDNHLFLPLVKVLAITQITHLSAELCRDAGERAVAAKLELGGSVASLLCILPLIKETLALIGTFGT